MHVPGAECISRTKSLYNVAQAEVIANVRGNLLEVGDVKAADIGMLTSHAGKK